MLQVARAITEYTAVDRVALFERLHLFIEEHFQEVEEEACDEFWGRFLEREDELSPELLQLSEDGMEVLRRWRRAAKSWSDQRLRWIAPYWKGPDMAALIERAYRLQP